MQELVRKFDPNLYGYASLNHAHQAMAKIADHVNDVKKQKENALRAKDIENYLTGWTGRDVSIIELACLHAYPRAWIITFSEEI